MGDLIGFLRAQFDYDEAFAIGWRNGGREYAGSGLPVDPARLLAEVKAKRAIVDQLAAYQPGWPGYREFLTCVMYLAKPYADHPDFDPAWRTS